MLRSSALAATGALLVPQFLTSCKKDDVPVKPPVVGESPLSTADLQLAAANIIRMREWFTDLYPLCIEYEDAVFHALAATKQTGGWTNFIADIFIDIAIALAAAAAAVSGAGAAGPAFALMSAVLHDWGIGKDKPTSLDAAFASFEFGHVRMQFVLEQKLSSLADPKNNYANLLAQWTDDIDFNGTTYQIGDLASSTFPELGDDYNALQSAAIVSFQSALWNLVIMKCCTYSLESAWNKAFNLDGVDDSVSDRWSNLLAYAKYEMYPQNKGRYLRAHVEVYPDNNFKRIWMRSWNLGIGGASFPAEAYNQLFKDDFPGNNNYNPSGLFSRAYVFQQFSLTKYEDFLQDDLGRKFYDLGTNYPSPDLQDNTNDFDFHGGMFKKLTH